MPILQGQLSAHFVDKAAPRGILLHGPTPWRDGRVDDGDGLENRCGDKATVGSNPTPSA